MVGCHTTPPGGKTYPLAGRGAARAQMGCVIVPAAALDPETSEPRRPKAPSISHGRTSILPALTAMPQAVHPPSSLNPRPSNVNFSSHPY